MSHSPILPSLGSRGERSAVGREGDGVDLPALTPQIGEQLPTHRVPQEHGQTPVTGGEHRAVGGKGHRPHRLAMPLENGDVLARRHLPQPHRGIIPPGGDQGPVR